MKKVIYGLIIILSIFILTSSIKAWSEYKIGDKVTYNDIDFYVIKNSGSNEDSVTMLKAEPLSYEEVENYSAGTGASLSDANGYGGMQYHLSSVEYSQSYVKRVVDAWKTEKVSEAKEVRMLTYDDLTDNLGYEKLNKGTAFPSSNGDTPDFVVNGKKYWTMSQYGDEANYVWYVDGSGSFTSRRITDNYITVRPVITLSKTALGDIDESTIDEEKNSPIINNNNVNKTKDNNTSTKVNVPNTYLSQSLIIMILGLITSCTSLVIYYIIKKKKEGLK